jgi:hypothetical protein
MHDSYKGVAEHFFLAKGKQQDVAQALGAVCSRDKSRVISTEQDISADLPDLFCEQADGCSQCQDEYDLLEKEHKKFVAASKISDLLCG